MRCLTRLASNAYVSRYRCSTGLRTYSFTSEIQALLTSFNADESKSFIAPSTALGRFHRELTSTDLSTKRLIERYNHIQRGSNLIILPELTAKLFLRRLLSESLVTKAVDLVLTYDLDQAVRLTVSTLEHFTAYERHALLLRLYQELLQQHQSGLANQILFENGYSRSAQEAFKALIKLQNDIALFDDLIMLQRQAEHLNHRMHEPLDAVTIHLVAKRALELDDNEFAINLIKSHPKASQAVSFVLAKLPVEASMESFKYLSEMNADFISPACWQAQVTRAQGCQHLEMLARYARDMETHMLIARKAIALPGCFEFSVSLSNKLSNAQLASLIYSWITILSSLPGLHIHIAKALGNADSPAEVIDCFLQNVTLQTKHARHNFPIQLLTCFMTSIEQSNVAVPAETQHIIALHFLHRPQSELLELVKLKFISLDCIRGVLNHHLKVLRYSNAMALRVEDDDAESRLDLLLSKDEQVQLSNNQQLLNYTQIESSVFSEVLKVLNKDRPQPSLYALYEHVLRSLIQLQPPQVAMEYLSDAAILGYDPTSDLVSTMVRTLSRLEENKALILHLMRHYDANTMTYDTFARYISRNCKRSVPTALEAFKIMEKRGFRPGPRLLQNMALRIAANPALTDSRAFRYLNLILGLAKKYAIPFDRVFLSALLRVVVLRQGLAASPTRVEYLLRHVRRLSTTSPITACLEQELLDILERWQLQAKIDPSMVSPGSSRPKRLRTAIETLGSRRTVRR